MDEQITDTNSEETPRPRLASLGDRAVAAFLDAFITLPLLFQFGTLEAIHVHAIADDGSYSMTGGPALVEMLLMALAWMTYAVVSEFWFGGTLGKRIMGIQARSANGRPMTFQQALVRNLFRWIDAIGLYLVGFVFAIQSKLRQRLGDRVADTAVFELEKPDRSMGLLYGIFIFFLGILLELIMQHFVFNRQ